jgi:hypothetical protein
MKLKRYLPLINAIITVIFCFSQNEILYALDIQLNQKKRVAVLEITTSDISSSFGNIARNAFEVFLFDSGKFQLLDRERQKSAAVKLGISASSDNSLEDLQKFGENISADYIISGNIDKLNVYRITIRIISVHSGEIITAHSQSFSSIDEFDPALNIISGKIKDNLVEYIRDGKIQKPFLERHNFSAGINFNYFIPVSSFKNLINAGPGTSGKCEISNIFFDNDYTGLDAGYYRFNGKKNNKDDARFIMMQAAYGYKFNLFNRLYFKANIESGINMITLSHDAETGFYMTENTRKKAVDPIVQFGFFAGITPIRSIAIEAGAQYGINFERGGNLYFFNLSAGLSATF